MSTELVIRIWNDEKVNPRLQLLKLIEVVENQGITQNNWKGLTVRASDLSEEPLQLPESLSSEQIADVLAKYEPHLDELHFSIWAALPCWRFEGMTALQGFVPFWLETWGDVFANRLGRCKEVEGNATFSLTNSGHFIALIEPKNDPIVQQVNNCVEENIEQVTDLIFNIINQLNPSTIKAFTDQGLYQPLNTHLVFFRDASVLVNDLNFLKQLWEEGLPGYNTPPLCDSINQLDEYALHLWRTLESSQGIITKLSNLMSKIEHFDSLDLDKINWQLYDSFDSTSGRIILDYPHWVNSFLDHFYLDLISIAINK